jgi:hypothetical protein
MREKYCWLVADKPSEQADHPSEFGTTLGNLPTDPNDMVFGPCPGHAMKNELTRELGRTSPLGHFF